MPPIDWAHMWHPQRSPWETMLRAVIVYVFVHTAFRVVGRRALGRSSTYEIVLLFFVGVVMRQSVVGNDLSLTTAILGFSTLIAVDALVTRLTLAFPSLSRLIDGPVRELVRDGRPNEAEMKRAHVSIDQLHAALRERGSEHLPEVRSAYLERSGRITILFAEGNQPARDAGPERDEAGGPS
jgi:uncharacterized membrane protein YcaP (DUF421 family)